MQTMVRVRFPEILFNDRGVFKIFILTIVTAVEVRPPTWVIALFYLSWVFKPYI